jgi:hypothetical protein
MLPHVADVLAAAFTGRTAKQASFLGLYTRKTRRDRRALSLLDALTGERIELMDYASVDELLVVTEALHAMRRIRRELSRPKRLQVIGPVRGARRKAG